MMRPKGKAVTECPHKDRKHDGRGLCHNCYNAWRQREYQKRKREEDPEWNADRQRKYRKTHPDSFNMLMARFYWRKLKPNQKQELIRRFP